jgi:NAD dependent epimerase/dehydratase family enzyme
MADALLLSGQRALPVRAADAGFSFRFSNIDEALADIFKVR